MSDSNIEKSSGGTGFLIIISLIVGILSLFLISHFQNRPRHKNKVYYSSEDAATELKGMINDFEASPSSFNSPHSMVFGVKVSGGVFLSRRYVQSSQYTSSKGASRMLFSQTRQSAADEWSGQPRILNSSENWDSNLNLWEPTEMDFSEIHYVANPLPDDEHFDLNENPHGLPSEGDIDGFFKPWRWRGTYALYDLPGGPYELRVPQSYHLQRNVPGVENAIIASSRDYGFDISFYSQVYSINTTPGFRPKSFPGKEKYKVYVKIYYRKLDQLPQSDGFPRYASSEIFSKIVEVEADTERHSYPQIYLSRALEMGVEFVKAEARGGYLRWTENDGGRWENKPILGGIPFAKWVPQLKVLEKEMTRDEAFPAE